MAPYVYDISWEGDSDSVESEEKSFCAPSRNRTGDLSLMRRGWYHKTIASALTSEVGAVTRQLRKSPKIVQHLTRIFVL
jgi:Uma2 family endonuclease